MVAILGHHRQFAAEAVDLGDGPPRKHVAILSRDAEQFLVVAHLPLLSGSPRRMRSATSCRCTDTSIGALIPSRTAPSLRMLSTVMTMSSRIMILSSRHLLR